MLRQYLQEQGRPYESLMILGIEIAFFAEESLKQSSIESFLNHCMTSDIELVWNVESAARSLLAKSLQTSGKTSLSEEEFEISQTLRQSAPVPHEFNNLGIEDRFSRLKDSGRHLQEKLTCWSEFLEEEKVKRDYSIRLSALLEAADIAANLLRSDRNPHVQRKFWEYQNEAEIGLQERRILLNLYLYHSSADDVNRLYREDGAILKWYDNFHVRYPHFNLPARLVSGYRKRKEIYERLHDLQNSLQMVQELNNCLRRDKEVWSLASPNARDSSSESPNRPDMGKHWGSEWAGDLNIYADEYWHFGGGSKETDLPPDGSTPFVTLVAGQTSASASSTFGTLVRWLQQAFASSELSRSELVQILFFEESLVEKDVGALLKEITPLDLSTRFSTMSSLTWGPIFAVLSDWLLNRSQHMETKTHYLLAYFQHIRANIVYSPDNKLIEAERMLDLLPKINIEAAASFKTCLPLYRNSLARAKKMILCRDLKNSGLYDETSASFQEIIQLYEQSLRECQAAGDLQTEILTLNEIASMYFIPASKLRPMALQNFFSNVEALEVVSQRLREGWKVLSLRNKVEKSLLAGEANYQHDLTANSMHLLCLYPESYKEQRDPYMWYIVQKMKARGFAWLMQTNALDLKAKAMQSSKQLQFLGSDPLTNWNQLTPIVKDSGGDVVFVDWYSQLGGPGYPPCPIIITSRNADVPKVWFTKIPWTEAEEVIDRFLLLHSDDLEDEESYKLLQKLQPLIQPLVQASQRGETLILCPVGKMSQIPLHALEINGEVLIRRNPIVYCSSLAALNVCFESRKLSELQMYESQTGHDVAEAPWKASFFGKPPTSDGQIALECAARRFDEHPYTKDAFTSSNFGSAICSGVNLLHFHGHAMFDKSKPLDRCLIFDNSNFTLGDAYDLAPAPRSYHVTLLACGSGMTQTSVSNEIIGLVPAFLYAGAASSVSTLWPFADPDASLFSDYFYEAFDVVLEEGSEGRVDLAKALQKAVLKIMEVKPELYHWAPFVLNGYWIFRLADRQLNVKSGK